MAEEDKVYPPPPVTTPKVAPWDAVQELCNRLDRLISLIEAWVPVTAPPGVPGVPSVPGVPGAPVELTIATQWKAGEPIEIFKERIRTAGTFYSPRLIDFRNGKRLVLKTESTLNQPVQIQAVANIYDNRVGIVEIGPITPCPANESTTIGLAWDDLTPYVGMRIAVATAPTTGELKIEGVVQY